MQIKYCNGCKVELPFSNFTKHKQGKFGLRSRCRACESISSKAWLAVNRDCRNAYHALRREGNAEHRAVVAKEWRLKNLERARSTGRKWAKENMHKNAEYASYRRSRGLQRTPGWLTNEDRKEIELLYLTARTMTEISGEPYHVDHILPIAAKLVCGLHVPSNLQILPGEENLRKNNRWTPE